MQRSSERIKGGPNHHLNKIAVAKRKARLLRFDLPDGKRTPSPQTKLWAGKTLDH